LTAREPDDCGESARTQGFRRSARQLEALDLRLEARPEDRRMKTTVLARGRRYRFRWGGEQAGGGSFEARSRRQSSPRKRVRRT
jgi:hypothetical protein